MVVVNAGTGATITDTLKSYSTDPNIEKTDLTGKVGKLDIQGPASAKALMKVLRKPHETLRGMRYFSFTGHFDEKSSAAGTFLEDGTPSCCLAQVTPGNSVSRYSSIQTDSFLLGKVSWRQERNSA